MIYSKSALGGMVGWKARMLRRSFMAFKTSFIFSFPFLSQFGWFYYIPGQGDLTTRVLCVTIWLHLL